MKTRYRRHSSSCGNVGKSAAVSTFPQPNQLLMDIRPIYRKEVAQSFSFLGHGILTLTLGHKEPFCVHANVDPVGEVGRWAHLFISLARLMRNAL